VVAPENWNLIRVRWRSLLNGFRDLVPSDRATCTIGSREKFFVTKLSLDQALLEQSLFLDQSLPQLWLWRFERFLLHIKTCTQRNQHSSFQKILITSSRLWEWQIHPPFIDASSFISLKTLRIPYSIQSLPFLSLLTQQRTHIVNGCATENFDCRWWTSIFTITSTASLNV